MYAVLFLYYVDSLHKININNCYATAGPQHPEPSSVYVDQRALRVDRVTVLEREAPHSVCLMECGKVGSQEHYTYCAYPIDVQVLIYHYLLYLQILPDVKLTIVHPDTKVPCAHTDLGEVSTTHDVLLNSSYTSMYSQIWVSSPHNCSGYYGLKDEINDALSREHFMAK